MSGLSDLSREELIALIIRLDATVQRLSERIRELEEENARLRGGGTSSPLCVKPSVPQKEKQPRKSRKQSFARKSLEPTQVIYHAVDCCPDCGRKLECGSEKWRHQVVDVPAVKVDVVDHVFMERRCGACGKRFCPDPAVVLKDVVVGKKRIGIRLMSVIAHLKTVCRVPIGQIKRLIETLWGLKISSGEIAEICHDVAQIGESLYEDLLREVRGSPVVHADETGWREDGVNGYIWSFSTPDVRYYTYRHSRGALVAKEVLSENFAGALVSDFYAAYNFYDGVKQRCWVHLARDLKSLVEKNPDLPNIETWVDVVLDVWDRAKNSTKVRYSELERSRLKADFESELLELCQPYLGVKTAPQRVLSERMTKFVGELFAFVANPMIPSENNAAERAVRPAVVARKISGGSRSVKGSQTCSVLRTLFETWTLQGRNTLDACQQMIGAYES